MRRVTGVSRDKRGEAAARAASALRKIPSLFCQQFAAGVGFMNKQLIRVAKTIFCGKSFLQVLYQPVRDRYGERASRHRNLPSRMFICRRCV